MGTGRTERKDICRTIGRSICNLKSRLDSADGYSELDTTDFLGFDETRLNKSDTVCYDGMAFYNGQWN